MKLLRNIFGGRKDIEFEFNGSKASINVDAYAHFIKAIDFYKYSNFLESVREIQLCINIVPQNQNMYYYLGFFAEEIPDHKIAIKAYEKSLEIDASQNWVMFRLAYCYQLKKSSREAISLFSKALIDFENFSDPVVGFNLKKEMIYSNRAVSYADVRESQRCIIDCSKAIELNPDYPNPYLIRGIERLKLHQKFDSEIDLQKAADLGMPQAFEILEEYFLKNLNKTAKVDNSNKYKIDILTEAILNEISNENLTKARDKMIQLFSLIKAEPSILKEQYDTGKLGNVFTLMLNNKISRNENVIEEIACIAYLLISKAILSTPISDLYKSRLLITEFARDEFNYSIRSALDMTKGGDINFFTVEWQMIGTKARDAIYKMEIADLYSNPILFTKLDFFKNKKIEFDKMIAENFFYNKTLTELINEGNLHHLKAYKYLYNKIIINEEIEI